MFSVKCTSIHNKAENDDLLKASLKTIILRLKDSSGRDRGLGEIELKVLKRAGIPSTPQIRILNPHLGISTPTFIAIVNNLNDNNFGTNIFIRTHDKMLLIHTTKTNYCQASINCVYNHNVLGSLTN